MSRDREVVAAAFDAWMAGTAPITDLFAEDMTWEIVGRSAASRAYADTAQFVEEVLAPFGARFPADAPFRPARTRAVYEDHDARTVIVVWDGRGTTTIGTEYANTYAWILTMRDSKVIAGTAFYDSKSFDELWTTVQP